MKHNCGNIYVLLGMQHQHWYSCITVYVDIGGLHNLSFPFKPKSQIPWTSLYSRDRQLLGFAQADILLR